ncbi:hypothetical protein AX17_005782 [Amanita inopinata Kibby_2008]|nr:hypothetical protein AX17_005782 [Amanita inopinata Kibby_2008]
MVPNSLLAPPASDPSEESRVIIGSRMLKEMLEHFPTTKGVKSDPQLVWSFTETEVGLKSFDTTSDKKAKMQISTELTINAGEFDEYFVNHPPITIAFHLREFGATIAYADSMNVSLVLRFTDPAAPLYIDIDGENDSSETLFVVSTSQVHGTPFRARSTETTDHTLPGSKRERDDRVATSSATKKLIRAVHPIEPQLQTQRSLSQAYSLASAPPQHLPDPYVQHLSRPTSNTVSVKAPGSDEPLFLPSSPQTSAANREASPCPLTGTHPFAVLEGHEANVKPEYMFHQPHDINVNANSVVEMELEATQKRQDESNFYPLFED